MSPHWHEGPLGALVWDGASPVIWRAADPGRGRRQQMVAMLLERLAGIPANSVRLARTVEGAPQVLSPRGWYIGLSGRGDACIVAAATVPVGVDREVVDDAPPLWDMMTPSEADAMRAAPHSMAARQWLRRWTIKEAHAKLVGTPRRIAPQAIETRLIDPVRAMAEYQGVSHGWTREQDGAIETVAVWAEAA